ncbi:cache domain-containing sensor histidine kinase [Cohnella abietis]|uniref:histidine kinase n=1 Tax=Cohnella abietis TaxID=2507935 RepID=A0A3T1D5P9_9BACL|nr:sensor histidine kinase [Cohnella abietis]BBI33430.1 sensor histidine kinase [Cohnella abietis]
MRHWLARSLKRKLSFLLLTSILVPLLSLGFFVYETAAMLTEEKSKQTGMNLLRQIDTNLEFVLQDVEGMSVFLIGQKDIQSYLDKDGIYGNKQTEIIGFLTNLLFSKEYISDITIYPQNGLSLLSTSTILHSGYYDKNGQNRHQFPAKSTKAWTSLYENKTTLGLKKVISFIRPIRDTNTFQEKGTLMISIDEEAISKYLKRSNIESSGFVVLLDNENRVISGSQRTWLNRYITEFYPGIEFNDGESGFGNYGAGTDKQTVLYYTVPKVGWKLVGFIPFREYTAQNRYVLLVTAAAVGVAIVLIAALILFFVQRVTRPLLSLTNYLRQVNPDEPFPTYTVTSYDEVGQLMHSYNKLSDRIERLTEQVKINESRKKEVDILALQSQINPHFLYNTLSSIHWMSLMNKDQKTAEMVSSLGDFLRFSLNQGLDYTPVKQEVDHARNYVRIQSIRYPDKFDVHFLIDPAMLDHKMLKLLLQPLIENALIHGLQKQEGKGKMYVHAGIQGDRLIFAVQDEGIGMDQDTLRKIEAGLNDTVEPHSGERGSYGLSNVHQRLLLHYDSESGLHIQSIAGKGTKVTFSIPIREEHS